jgi:hypothetical protein
VTKYIPWVAWLEGVVTRINLFRTARHESKGYTLKQLFYWGWQPLQASSIVMWRPFCLMIKDMWILNVRLCRFSMVSQFIRQERAALWSQPNVMPKDWAARSADAVTPDVVKKNGRSITQPQRSQIFDRLHQNENLSDQRTIGSTIALLRSFARATRVFLRLLNGVRSWQLEIGDRKCDTLLNPNCSSSTRATAGQFAHFSICCLHVF